MESEKLENWLLNTLKGLEQAPGILRIDHSYKIIHINEIAQFHFGLEAHAGTDFSRVLFQAPSLLGTLKATPSSLDSSFEFGPLQIWSGSVSGVGYRGETEIWLISFGHDPSKWGMSYWLKQGARIGLHRVIQHLHDGVAPPLILLRMAIKKLIRSDHKEEIQISSLQAMEKLVEETHLQIRALVDKKKVTSILGKELLDKISQYCQWTNQLAAPTVRFYCDDFPESLEDETAMHIFEISKELINNAIKYAKPTQIDLQLILDGKQVILSVEDDGIGFDKEKIRSSGQGHGLDHLIQRTEAMGGTYLIESGKGKGTFMSIQFPINYSFPLTMGS